MFADAFLTFNGDHPIRKFPNLRLRYRLPIALSHLKVAELLSVFANPGFEAKYVGHNLSREYSANLSFQ